MSRYCHEEYAQETKWYTTNILPGEMDFLTKGQTHDQCLGGIGFLGEANIPPLLFFCDW